MSELSTTNSQPARTVEAVTLEPDPRIAKPTGTVLAIIGERPAGGG